MGVQRQQFIVTTDAAGAGTAICPLPVSGQVLEFRAPNAASQLTLGGSADFTFTRVFDGGTILTLTNASAPWEYRPRQALHTTTGGTTAYSLGGTPVLSQGVPVDTDYIKCVVAQGALSTSGTVYVYIQT